MKNPKLHSQTLSFLQGLDDFNDRKFFNLYKDLFLQIKDHFSIFVQELINEISKFDTDLNGELSKNAIFRIYKDCRRPINRERPYKINLGASLSHNGRKGNFAGYYLHIQNNESFFSVGTRRPKPKIAYKIREKIYTNWEKFQKILNSKNIKDNFIISDKGDKLKKPNRNSQYSKILGNVPGDHPSLELLSMKSWLLHKNLKNENVLSEDFFQNCLELAKLSFEYKKFLNDIKFKL